MRINPYIFYHIKFSRSSPINLKNHVKQEYRIPIKNNTPNKIHCEFKALNDGYNAEMHNFMPHPFRYIMPPGESIKIFQTIKANFKFDDDEFEKRTEMRKILYVHIRDSDIYIPQPLNISITKMSDTNYQDSIL